ncbi:hypothetical protein [Streptomyces cellulosae]|uniref:Uncharacterized protein n=1 Tax=Streptomyces cellulosae TaxID=1968 RepID=A0ABW7YHU8_STRCE
MTRGRPAGDFHRRPLRGLTPRAAPPPAHTASPGVEGVSLPPALRLHFTPDTVPERLYETVRKLGLKLQLSPNGADIDQAGQTGGELATPGRNDALRPRHHATGSVDELAP